MFRAILLLIAACVVADAFDFGNFLPLIPTEKEIKICNDNANGKTIRKIYKLPLKTCYIQCLYGEESEAQEFVTPDGTLCCDIVGVGPTGTCKKGECVLFGKEEVEKMTEN